MFKKCLFSVNCIWSSWSPWDNCSATCGGGTKIRSRFVSQPSQNGGSCSGKSAETQSCGETPCGDVGTIDCTWSAWSPWDACSVTCGGGTKMRSRFVSQPSQNGGSCSGKSAETQSCGSAACGGSGKGWLTFHFSNL